MALSIRDPNTGQISSWVWLAVGAVFFVVIFIFLRSGSAPASTGSSTAIIPDSGTSNIPLDTGTKKKKNPTNPGDGLTHFKLLPGEKIFKLFVGEKFSTTLGGALTGVIKNGQRVIVKLVTINGEKWYQIINGPFRGDFVKVPKTGGNPPPPLTVNLSVGEKFFKKLGGTFTGTIKNAQSNVSAKKVIFQGHTWYKILEGPRKGEFVRYLGHP